jgi:hypothetical protein
LPIERLLLRPANSRTRPQPDDHIAGFVAAKMSQSDYMSLAQLAFFRTKLETMRAETLAHAQHVAHELHEEVPSWPTR